MAEVLVSGSDPSAACGEAGRQLALEGSSLEEALTGLRTTWLAVCGCEPAAAALTQVALAWSDTMLGYLHQLSCEDPVTGLATSVHVRSRLADLYRVAEGQVHHTHALVLGEVEQRTGVDGPMLTSLRLARVGSVARTVFPGQETIGRLGSHRVVVVAERNARLARRVRLLRMMSGDEAGDAVRVWIEGLPAEEGSAALLLDELLRD